MLRSSTAMTVSASGGEESRRLRLALAGRQPVGDDVGFRFELPAPNRAVIEIFDVSGCRVGGSDLRSWSAGPHEVSWRSRDLSAGVYEARVTADGRHQIVRLVRVR